MARLKNPETGGIPIRFRVDIAFLYQRFSAEQQKKRWKQSGGPVFKCCTGVLIDLMGNFPAGDRRFRVIGGGVRGSWCSGQPFDTIGKGSGRLGAGDLRRHRATIAGGRAAAGTGADFIPLPDQAP
jgi:hypothetical protein